jgi:hypothetical protein
LCKNKGLYVYLYLLSRDAWEQGIIYLQISFILYCVRTRDYMFIYIFYLVMLENKGLYVCMCLVSRDAWEQGIICKYLLFRNVYMCLLSRDAWEQGIICLSIFFYLVMRKNKGLYVYMCLVSRIAWEQGIVCLFISFISYCLRTRDYIFANIF